MHLASLPLTLTTPLVLRNTLHPLRSPWPSSLGRAPRRARQPMTGRVRPNERSAPRGSQVYFGVSPITVPSPFAQYTLVASTTMAFGLPCAEASVVGSPPEALTFMTVPVILL